MQELLVVFTLSVFNICWGVIASLPVSENTFIEKKRMLQAPLFPIEASEKGASGSQISPGESLLLIERLTQFLVSSVGHHVFRPLLHLLSRPIHGQQVRNSNLSLHSQVWSLLRLPDWNPCGEPFSSPLWHDHFCLSAQPLSLLCLPRPLHRGSQHGRALVHCACNPPHHLPQSSCGRLLHSRHHLWSWL